METKKMTQERISALSDGELSDAEIDSVLADLRRPDGRAAWDAYQQIGDLLRSDDMAVTLSPGFAARMAARLEAEPTIIAPVPRASASIPVREATNDAALPGKPVMRRFAMPGMVVAAAAALTFIATPQLMVAIKAGPATMEATTAVASAGGSAPEASVIAAVGPQKVSATGGKSQPVVLRNQGLDEYLMAHQRFSPSVYSTAQFARSSTFANDSGK